MKAHTAKYSQSNLHKNTKEKIGTIKNSIENLQINYLHLFNFILKNSKPTNILNHFLMLPIFLQKTNIYITSSQSFYAVTLSRPNIFCFLLFTLLAPLRNHVPRTRSAKKNVRRWPFPSARSSWSLSK